MESLRHGVLTLRHPPLCPPINPGACPGLPAGQMFIDFSEAGEWGFYADTSEEAKALAQQLVAAALPGSDARTAVKRAVMLKLLHLSWGEQMGSTTYRLTEVDMAPLGHQVLMVARESPALHSSYVAAYGGKLRGVVNDLEDDRFVVTRQPHGPRYVQLNPEPLLDMLPEVQLAAPAAAPAGALA